MLKKAALMIANFFRLNRPVSGVERRNWAIKNRQYMAILECAVWLSAAIAAGVYALEQSVKYFINKETLLLPVYVFFSASVALVAIPLFSSLVLKAPPLTSILITMVDGIASIGREQHDSESRAFLLSQRMTEADPRQLLVH